MKTVATGLVIFFTLGINVSFVHASEIVASDNAQYFLRTLGEKLKGLVSKKPKQQVEANKTPVLIDDDDAEGQAIICEQAEAEGHKSVEDVSKGFAEQIKKECPPNQLKSKDCLYLLRYVGTMQNCFRKQGAQ